MRLRIIAAFLLAVAYPFLLFGLALIGEPQSKWIVCDLMGLCS